MHSKSPIIPGDLTTTKADFEARLGFARDVADTIHIDITDGDFVEAKSLEVAEWPPLEINYAEAHLMVRRPMDYLDSVKKAGVTRAIVHIESFFDLDELVDRARSLDLLLGFAINPDTDLEHLKPFFEVGNYIQVMGIEPGKTGQKMLAQTPLGVAYLRKIPSRRLIISVDGGVHLETLTPLVEAGANYFVASSALYDKGDWTENYKHMLSKVESIQV